MSLVSLAKIAGKEEDYEKVFQFLDTAQALETLFEKEQPGGTNTMILQMKVDVLAKQGETKKALEEMEHLVDTYIKLAENEKEKFRFILTSWNGQKVLP